MSRKISISLKKGTLGNNSYIFQSDFDSNNAAMSNS